MMRDRLLDAQELTTTTSTAAIRTRYLSNIAFEVAVTLPTVAKTFLDAAVDVDANTIAIAAHGFITGTLLTASSAGVLPAGLSAGDYYAIKVSSGSIKLAATKADALAGTAVDITAAAGGGIHTLTPKTTIASASAGIYGCASETGTYILIGSATNIIGAGSIRIEDEGISYPWVKCTITQTGGSFNATVIASGHEDPR